MREANFMSLKEKADLENQLKLKQRQSQMPDPISQPKHQEPVPAKKEPIKVQDDLFKGKAFSLISEEKAVDKGDQSLPQHFNAAPPKIEKKREKKKEPQIAHYIGTIESDIEDSEIHEDISIGHIEEDISLLETQNQEQIEKKQEPLKPKEDSPLANTKEIENELKQSVKLNQEKQNETKEDLKEKEKEISNEKVDLLNPNQIPKENDQKSEGELGESEIKEQLLAEVENHSLENLSSSVNSEKIRSEELKFKELLGLKGRSDENENKWKNLAEERLNKNLLKLDSPENDDLEARILKLQEHIDLVNKSMITNIQDEKLKKKFEDQDKKFGEEMKMKLEKFKTGSSQIKEQYNKDINLD